MSAGLYILAILPCLLVLIYIYIRDRHERESLYVYLLCILFGVCCAWLSYHLSTYIRMLFLQQENTSLLLEVFIGIALIEQLTMFVFFILFLYPNKNFNEYFDGVVYGVSIAMGFAAIENLLYLEHYPSVQLALLRMFTAIPAHGLFGGYMGGYIAKAKFIPKKRWGNIFLSIAISTLLHGAYDFFVFIDGDPNWIFVSVAILVFAFIWGRRVGSYLLKHSPFKNKESWD